MSSAELLEQFRLSHAHSYAVDINLALRPAYHDLLARLGNPQLNCPPVFHVAGTNGKGSTCAFLRAILEAAGYKVHVYTSPHLVRFHERIRIAGQIIEESYLVELLEACARHSKPGHISYFEAATAAAFLAFAQTQADFTILETGLGGRLDATNIVEKPLATLITRLSYDHREYLGETLGQIAQEKAGIMRKNVPCFTAPQPDTESIRSLQEAAAALGTKLFIGGIDWHVSPKTDGFYYSDGLRQLSLPPPALTGEHQLTNAGLALAALSTLPQPVTPQDVANGLRCVEWPARLQQLKGGKLTALLPPMTELWLDGGHNDSAGEVLSLQAAAWQKEDSNQRPLHIVIGMLSTKSPREFLTPLLPYITHVTTLTIPDEPLSISANTLAQEIRALGVHSVDEADNLTHALQNNSQKIFDNARVLICGSLYLAGHVLACN